MMEYTCEGCKHEEAIGKEEEEYCCDECSGAYTDAQCTCHTGNPPCGACESYKYVEKEGVKCTCKTEPWPPCEACS